MTYEPTEMFLGESYWFHTPTLDKIKLIETKYNAQWMGSWDNGGSSFPDDIFYVENPDISKGHTHYFGLYLDPITNDLFIRKGDKAFSNRIIGCVNPQGIVYASRYRHDYISVENTKVCLDGGRDYIKVSGDLDYYNKNKIEITVDKDQFQFKRI